VSSATKWNIEHHGNALAKFLAGLRDAQNLFEAAALIEYLQTSRNELREPRSKSLGNGLFELRGKQVRIFMSSGAVTGSCFSMECSRTNRHS
jgi:hypothetical protein